MNKSVEILNFIYNRLVHFHKDDPNMDCMVGFFNVIKEFQLTTETNELLKKLNSIHELHIKKYKELTNVMQETISLYKNSDNLKTSSLLNHYSIIDRCKKIIDDYNQQKSNI